MPFAQKKEEYADLPAHAAGRLMAQNIPIIRPDDTIASAERFLMEHARDLATINYLYVADKERLVGVLSIKEVFRSLKTTPVADLMRRELITARPHTEAGRIALLAIEHNLKEIPIVNGEGKLLGSVGSDMVLHILHEKHVTEMLSVAGVHGFQDSQKLASASIGLLLKKRLPWLLLGLGGSIIAAAIIGSFHTEIQATILLAAFIPAVTYISGAVGAQGNSIFVRTLALDRNFKFGAYIRREIQISFSIAILLAITMGFVSFLVWQNQVLSIILASSFLISILASSVISIFLPWIFLKYKVDPALVSAPFDTILSDIVSITIYFALASFILRISA
ncbi:MAG: magnesium transporter [Patescibacteria group bacterium]